MDVFLSVAGFFGLLLGCLAALIWTLNKIARDP